MSGVVKYVLDSTITSVMNQEILSTGNELKKFKKYIADHLLQEEDREAVPNMGNFDVAFKNTWQIWKTTPVEARDELCYPEFQKLFFVENEETPEDQLSSILNKTSGNVMENELSKICDQMNIYKNTISDKMLSEPEEMLESVTNLANFEEAFRRGWKIWKKAPEADHETLSYELFKNLMINGSD